jgi:hypothetical protein
MSGFALFDPFVEGSGILNGLTLSGDCEPGGRGCLFPFGESFDLSVKPASRALGSFVLLSPFVECCGSLNELTLGALYDTRDGLILVLEDLVGCIVG